MLEDPDAEYLLLSGIQHMAFCPRQWALIHIEQLWADNRLTVEGHYLHERVDNSFLTEKRGSTITVRAMPIRSELLRLQGIADVVEFWETQGNGLMLPGRKGRWIPVPIEYKRGKHKTNNCDRIQVCAQAICLEEMLGTSIKEGFIFYEQSRRREAVHIDDELRLLTQRLAVSMYQLFSTGVTPPAVWGNQCQQCSLLNQCTPQLVKKKIAVNDYISNNLIDEV